MTLEQELDLLMNEPEEGSFIRLEIGYPGSPKVYTYAGVEAAGLWYITGADGASGRSWEGLVNWLKSKDADVVSLCQTTSWEEII